MSDCCFWHGPDASGTAVTRGVCVCLVASAGLVDHAALHERDAQRFDAAPVDAQVAMAEARGRPHGDDAILGTKMQLQVVHESQ